MDLGYPRYSDFWLWNDRVKIYIYPDHKLYLKATGEPDWSHGFADYKKKQITSYDRGEDFINSFLPHEIAHLVFRDFIGFKGEAPLWLDEGVAQWAELPKRMEFKSLIKKAYDENSLLMLEYIMDLNIRRLKEKKVYIRRTITKKGEPSVLFLSKKGILDTYYLQAFSLIGFLIEEHGADKFSHFCRQLRDGKSLKQALSFAYSTVYIRNIEELETKWREYLAGS